MYKNFELVFKSTSLNVLLLVKGVFNSMQPQESIPFEQVLEMLDKLMAESNSVEEVEVFLKKWGFE